MKNQGVRIPVLIGSLILSLLQGTAVRAQNEASPKSGPASPPTKEQFDVFTAFNLWADRSQSSAVSGAKSSSESEGIGLAKQRRAVLAELVKSDPARALALALPASVREKLSAAIADELETPISDTGDFSVRGALQRVGGPSVQPIQRIVRIKGKTYPAYVHNRLLSHSSKKKVALRGILVDGAVALENIFDGDGNAFAPSGPAANPPTAWTTGLKNVLIIRVDFSDLPGEPVGNNDTSPISNNNTLYTEAYVQDIADNRISPFYFQSSYGQTELVNTVSPQVYRMPQTANAYATSPTGSDKLHDDARAAVAADFNLANFDRIAVLFSNLGDIPDSFITYGGLAQLVDKNIWLNGEFDFRVMTHELGHTYGLWHAGLWAVTDGNPISPTGTIIEYGDDFDTMGANFANDPRTDFNPYYKNILGWIPDHKIQVASTNGSYRIYAFDTANFLEATNNPILALKFVKDSNRTYWIGARRNFANNSLMYNGAYVMWGFNSTGGGSGGGYQSGLLDLTTPGTSPTGNLPNDYDAALDLKAKFQDPAVNLLITPLSGDNSVLNGFLDVQFGLGSSLLVYTNLINGGNGNGIIDFNECNNLYVGLTNSGLVVSNVSMTITTTTPKTIIAQPFSSYPSITNGGSSLNLIPFKISTTPDFVCGTPIDLTLILEVDGEIRTNFLRLPSGVTELPVRFNNNTAIAIPDGDPAGVSSPIVVSNFNSVVGKVSVALHITHPINFDLQLQLIAPDGTAVMLSQNNGGGGQNYGIGCGSDNLRTRFDDSAVVPISSANAPFVGVYQPEQPLSTFNQKSGTNVNGIWQLKVVDQTPFLTGVIQCWSLSLSAQSCTDGGGECPGADLGLTITDAPDPVVVTSNLTYTITVTNHGPSTAKAVVLNQVLPAGAIFRSATNSQGTVQHSGGVISCNFNQIPPRGSATAVIVVTPTTIGDISSTATVGSNQADSNTSDNSVTVITRVTPASADLGVVILDSPDPVSVGGALVYTIAVTNRGPTAATNVRLTNALPNTAVFVSANSTQGSFINNGGTIIYNLGAIANGSGAVATITVRPTEVGVITATAQVGSDQADLIPGNNLAGATTIVSPAADLALSIVDSPDPAIVSSNVTYTFTLTNRGPHNVSSVTINGTLPPSALFVTSSIPMTVNGDTFSLMTGPFASGSSLVFSIILQAPAFPEQLTLSAIASASLADPNLVNNTATATTVVAFAEALIAADGSTLIMESISPANGSVDSGETVDVALRLRNVGNISTTNLIATLQSGNGVSSPSAAQSYGVLTNGSASVSRTFRFTANGTNGQTITATLRLQDGSGPVTNVSFAFTLPAIQNFSNTNLITISNVGPAHPYPSQITVAGVSGLVDKVTVSLNKINHTYSDDIDILLVDPTGRKVVLMSDVGGANLLTNVVLTLDSAATSALSDSDQLVSGSFLPADFSDAPADFFTNAPAGPYETSLETFDGTAPNGTWSLYVVDDTSGDKGTITGGWSLNITTIKPVNRIADLTLAVTASKTTALVNETISYTFVVTNNGPDVASNVTLNNPLPANATALSTTFTNLGDLAPGSNAVVTLTLTTTATGLLTNSAVVSASEIDLNLVNNSASAVTSVGLPVADLGISLATAPTSIAGSNLVYTITVTNAGPDTAHGIVVTNRLPAAAVYVSSDTVVSVFGNVITCALGNLSAGNSVSFSITATPLAAGTITNSANVITGANDQNGTNNFANITTLVANPSPNIIASGAYLDAENLVINGSVDPNETVTISLALANNGSAPTANLIATLQSTGGVTVPSGPQNYGAVVQGGATVSRSFVFTASGTVGGTVTATLQLQDGARNLGSATFTFALPNAAAFTNVASISIPNSGPATPYPSTITVSGATGVVSKVTVALKGVTHSFPDDMDILLVSPAGQQMLLLSDVGGAYSLNGVNLSFDDSGTALPDAAQITSGDYRPTNFDLNDFLSPPAPGGSYASSFATFTGSNPNGDWSLYVNDDTGADFGSISGGWTLNLTMVTPINVVPNEFILSALLVNGECHLTLNGKSGSTYRIEACSDLLNWTPISTNVAVNGVCNVIDSDSPNFNPRFYRAVLVE